MDTGEPTSDTSLTETYSAMAKQETLASLRQETQHQQIPEPEEQAQIHQLKHEQEEEEVLPDQNDSIIAQDALEQLDTSFEDRREEEEDLNTKQRRKRKGIPIKVRELQGTPLKARLNVPSLCPCLSQASSKFIIVPMMTDRLGLMSIRVKLTATVTETRTDTDVCTIVWGCSHWT